MPSSSTATGSSPRKTETTIRRLAEKVFWIAAALVLGYYTELPNALLEYGYGWPIYVSMLCLTGIGGIFAYLTFYLPYFTLDRTRINLSNWEREAPRSIQTATVLGLTLTVCVNVWLWPAFGILTPVILFVEFLGFICLLAMF
ncbi:uncharacterized protein BJ171DRAFT_540863 [Polychytrium aggregatum]|uniref:uncharacterized protein n=1 Tax=Polychytrium aggregatum TaxID=110093 RepID=UPI0022FEEF15|nr:uncharacterized protein BJ171DRAFT_540863 [Polychytrium aggregatum]KAI9190757.1 hypothetical protein BJ171DRAFT_540863 [Polychytrium aggregatum]